MDQENTNKKNLWERAIAASRLFTSLHELQSSYGDYIMDRNRDPAVVDGFDSEIASKFLSSLGADHVFLHDYLECNAGLAME